MKTGHSGGRNLGDLLLGDYPSPLGDGAGEWTHGNLPCPSGGRTMEFTP